ncbi:MAG: hypothetical protein J1F37_05190 [Oscillospiraceae bacterium]|nr:hypothetical protein [Oscillospiraceae bacterium]
MKKIHNKKDIQESNLPVPIKKVLNHHLHEICNTYNIDDISEFGSLCYIESPKDLEQFDLNVIEWSVSVEIISDTDTERLYYFCILIDNDTGVNILADEKYLREGVIKQLIKTHIRTEKHYF